MTVLSESPLVYAHRGASAELPENTLEAFERAIFLGADAIETDVHVTRDGRLVLSHDPTPARTSQGRVARAIREASFAEVRSWDVGEGLRMPSLEDALAAFPAVPFNIDAKEDRPDVIPLLLRAIRAFGAEDRVRIASFHGRNLRRARAMGWKGRLGMSRDELLVALFAPKAVCLRMTRGSDAAQVPPHAAGIDFTSQRTIDRLHARGFRVDIWVVDDPETARALLARGVDGLITNDPRAIVPAVRGL
jgi:glycerophosphoryl diester phosphodiesterase